jgi:hypothetical protein
MAKKTATIIVDNSAAQVLVGWENGKPDITKISGKPVDYVSKWYKTATLTVDDGVITSKDGHNFYWIMGGNYYVKKEHVTLS